MSDMAPTLTPVATAAALPQASARARLHVLEATITVLRRFAFHEASYDLVAATAGVPVAEVKVMFPTWESLLIATLDLWHGRRTTPLLPVAEHHGAAAFLRALVQSNIEDPALMRVLSATVNIAATPGHPMAAHLQEAWVHFHVLVMRQLAKDIEVGREPDTMNPARGAEQLVALYEGLQLQSMVRPGMDLLDAFDRAMTRMRDGWSRTYTPPVWDLDIA